MKTPEEKCAEALSYARGFIRNKAPYVSKTLYGLVPYTAPGTGTIAVTDQLVLLVDPLWFPTMKTPMAAATVMHEISHVIRGLHRLAAFPNQDLANIAFDMPINEDLRTAGWELPDWVVYPETYGLQKGLTGEQYYELLEKLLQKKDGRLCKALGEGELKVGSGKCGGMGGSSPVPDKEKEANNKVGRSRADVENIRFATGHDIREYVKGTGKGRGTVPRSILQWLPDDAEKLVWVSWKTELEYALRTVTGRAQSGRADYSYRRLSRRSFFTRIAKPGMIDRLPVIAFVEDTSGSMGADQLKEGRLQAVDIFEQLGITEAWWISADAAVSRDPEVLTIQQIRELPVVGRGGTDFRPAIARAELLHPKPDILIYLTDGDGAAPEFPPIGIDVVFCIVPGPYSRPVKADWATNIVLEDRLVAA
jgi:predicted metal-dependent peptidase